MPGMTRPTVHAPGGLAIMTLKFAYFCKDHRPALAQLKARFEVSMLYYCTNKQILY